MRDRPAFRQKLRSSAPLLGTFVKIPHPQVVEVLAATALDFIILDAEHAAFGATALDQCLMAARLSGLPALVRVPAIDRAAIGAVLDMGAAGVVVPHVSSLAEAEDACRAALYNGGWRGISGSHRAAGYGRGDLAAFARESDEGVAVIAQIEDASALAEIDRIVRADRVDCFFIGRADLALSLGEAAMTAPAVEAAVAKIANAVRAAGKSLGGFVDASGIQLHLDQGYNFLAVGTDHGMLRAGANFMQGNRAG